MAKAGTQRQKRVARKLVDNLTLDKPLTAGEMLENVGYSKHLVKQPGRIIQSEGVQTELIALGFDPENAKKVVGEILDDETVEPQHRLKAAEQVFKVHGSYAPEKSASVNIEVKQNREKLAKVATEVMEKLSHEELNG